jgi:hypothetical protein
MLKPVSDYPTEFHAPPTRLVCLGFWYNPSIVEVEHVRESTVFLLVSEVNAPAPVDIFTV